MDRDVRTIRVGGSLSDFFQTKEVDLLQRPERISRPEPVEDKGTPWISSLKEKDIDLSVFKQLTASRREFATR